MPKFGSKSRSELATCTDNIQAVFNEVIKIFDCSIQCGTRGKKKQNAYYYGKPQRSKVKYPNSKHNSFPSKGIDACPYPYDDSDRERITLFAGMVIGIAAQMEIKIRWGGDWDQDTQVKNNDFDDLFHFEEVTA